MVGRVHIGVFGEPDGAVGMQFQRLPAHHRLDGRNQGLRPRGLEQPARVLDIERIDERTRCELARPLDVVGIVMDGTQGEHQRHDDVFAAALLHHACAGHVRFRIVHGVREAEAPDAVARQRAECERHEIRAGGLPGYEPKAGRHELQRRMRRRGRHESNPLPRVFLLVSHRHTHVRRGREVDGAKSDAVHHLGDGQRSAPYLYPTPPTGTGCRRAARSRPIELQPCAARASSARAGPAGATYSLSTKPVSTPPA